MDNLERARFKNLIDRVNALPLQSLPTAEDQLRQINSIAAKMLDADATRETAAARVPKEAADLSPVPRPMGLCGRVGDRLGNLGEGS